MFDQLLSPAYVLLDAFALPTDVGDWLSPYDMQVRNKS